MEVKGPNEEQPDRKRVDFGKPGDDHRFHLGRDDWRRRACAEKKMPKIAIRIAGILADHLNRQDLYCYPTDEQLAIKLQTSERNIGKGLRALDGFGYIERKTIPKRDENREVIGRVRSIYLTVPVTSALPISAREPSPTGIAGRIQSLRNSVKTAVGGGERNTSEVNGTEVNGTPEVNGTNRAGERNDGVPNTPDNNTPDNSRFATKGKSGSYAHARARGNPFRSPGSWGDDLNFLSVFDRFVIETTGGQDLEAGAIERVTQEAFDRATDSDEMFMPCHWAAFPHERKEWFRWRASQLVHHREAA
ncbi:hypothetical protein E3C22_03450 [Jiella endophytica]|uniref:Helix-turn-helix domain-containing protein n=1 Tax=Jiella endophytica TaxID=2558362 RepID=A0A4Y8RTG6_9HYPH|nr:hypothetical protein [Jiella endophytica]TFF27526.1 hypothetical protein E3C22_03450 [Jiella endophytica]